MLRQNESGLFFDSLQLRFLVSGDKKQSWKAFENIFNKYQGRIFRMAVKYMCSKEQAEEVVQEVFLNLWLNREKFGEVEAFNAYLFVSARNVIKGAIRKMLATKDYQTEYAANRDTVASTIEDSVHNDHRKALIMDAIKLLSP